jgi:hypothetical protein
MEFGLLKRAEESQHRTTALRQVRCIVTIRMYFLCATFFGFNPFIVSRFSVIL